MDLSVKRVRLFAILVVLAATLPLSSSTTTDPLQRSTVEPRENTIIATRTFAGKCVVAAPVRERAILGGVIEPVISLGVKASIDLFVGAIRKAAEANTTSVSATANIEIDDWTTPDCVQIIQGRFYSLDEDFTKDSNSVSSGIAGAHDKLKTIGAYLAEDPRLFFEGQIRRSTDKTAIAISPSFLLYNQPIGPTARSNVRDLVFSFAISPPGSSPNGNSGTVGQLQFNDVSFGTRVMYDSLSPDKVSSPETPWIPLATTEHPAPVTVSITVSETRDANEFLLFVADTLSGSKEQLETLLKQTLVESERNKLREQQAETERKLHTEATNRVVDAIQIETEARVAIQKYDSLSDDVRPADRLAAAGDARSKQLKANLAATNAGLPSPFLVEDLISLHD
jgi:hypothetical protein